MSRVKNRNTKPELVVRSLLHQLGFRFRLHRQDLPGTPDITLPKYKTVVFVHGCFWHGHDCNKGKLPNTRRDFWKEKTSINRDRDKANLDALNSEGWSVITVWECQTKSSSKLTDLSEMFMKLKLKNQ